jgi:hypothetical protein
LQDELKELDLETEKFNHRAKIMSKASKNPHNSGPTNPHEKSLLL